MPDNRSTRQASRTTARSLTASASLREFTVSNGDIFAQSVTEKLLTYAIGRGLEYEDMPLVRSITHDAAEDDYRFSSLLMGVIRSPAFTMNAKTAADTTAANTE